MCIDSSIPAGSFGFTDDTPFTTLITPSLLKVTLSILGKKCSYPIKELSWGVTVRLGFVDAEKSLLENANGDVFVAVNLPTLGLKSKVSEILIPVSVYGMSFLNDSDGYEFTVNTSPVSLLGTSK